MATTTNDPSLYTKTGVEKPTHTTSHNQVIVADIPDPSGEVMDNYAELRRQRDCSWDDIAAGVEVQDPVLADYLRQHGPEHDNATADEPGIAPVLTDRAVNPLTTPEERDAVAAGAPIGSTEAEAAATGPAKADTAKASAGK